MHWALLGVLACVGCTPCEPYIEYDKDVVLQGPDTCPNLMFAEQPPLPVEWYPRYTIALVQECNDPDSRVRAFACGTVHNGEWDVKLIGH